MKSKPGSFSDCWNLDTLFSGGSQSPALLSELDHLKHQIKDFEKKFKRLSDIKAGILHYQELERHTHDLQEFINCLLAQNVNDLEAIKLNNQISTIRSQCDSLGDEVNRLLAELDEETFVSLIEDSDLNDIAFHLQEKRDLAKEKSTIDKEQIINKLTIDGYQGWNDLYNTLVGQLSVPSPFKKEKALSIGQAYNQLNNPKREIRAAWFKLWEGTWTSQENLGAQILNHLAGFRLNVYQTRKWSSIIHEPLLCNRMKEETLQSMWNEINRSKGILVHYLNRKAQLLGLDQLAWYDIEAPLPFDSQTVIPFQDAAQLIIESFSHFSPDMGVFAEKALNQHWIEAKDRSEKRPGGFCASFSRKKQSRIFMTYSDTMSNVFTLAHELGHAYHSQEVQGLPFFAQQYRMSIAETASTLAEMVVVDRMIKTATDPVSQLCLLDNKLQRAVLFLMNIQSRFLFEFEFYQQRKKGLVMAQELNLIMENSQRKAFENTLSEWHPHFWLSKQHFYSTDVPFYNFPYTFGYLFSQGIYAKFKNQSRRGEAYASLLRDTARMNVENLAELHLGVKLEEPEFWQNALKLIQEDVDFYLKLSSNKGSNV